MRRHRGYTLVELMIAVAVLGIVAALAVGAGKRSQLWGLDEFQRERALLLLEYQAERLSTGQPVEAAVVQRLVDQLPDAKVHERSGAGVTTVTVTWRAATGGPGTRSLTVFTRVGGP